MKMIFLSSVVKKFPIAIYVTLGVLSLMIAACKACQPVVFIAIPFLPVILITAGLNNLLDSQILTFVLMFGCSVVCDLALAGVSNIFFQKFGSKVFTKVVFVIGITTSLLIMLAFLISTLPVDM